MWGPWSLSPGPHPWWDSLEKSVGGVWYPRLHLSCTLKSPLLSSRGKVLRAENRRRLPCLSIKVVVIIDLALNLQRCSRLLLPHPKGRRAADGRGMALRTTKWTSVRPVRAVGFSSPTAPRNKHWKGQTGMGEDQGESRKLKSNLKDEEGSLRLTCGSTQHTSVGT